jgi:hypothetical protein
MCVMDLIFSECKHEFDLSNNICDQFDTMLPITPDVRVVSEMIDIPVDMFDVSHF